MTLPRIRLLNRLLANQIAAGEVIERPASVLKELLENSIDAGATQIDVEIQQGGLRLIKVRDNGCGILKEDLHLAICRHATSKIAHLEDLQAIESLGFRGEALASIAAVSRFWISSKTAEQDQAWQLQGHGIEDDMQLQPTAHPQGTSIVVQDLFFNTPARRKFMRSEKTEYLQLEEVFKRIALSHLNIGFSLSYEKRLVFRLLPANTEAQQQRRIAKIFGKNFLEKTFFVDVAATGLSLSGWLGMPSLHRSQNDLQYIYLNGRLVKDKVINHALRQVYADLLPEGRYALYILYFKVDPHLVDVNVHPTKHEVRFQQARLIHDFLVHALRKSLQKIPIEKHYAISSSEVEAYKITENVMETEYQQPISSNSLTLHWGKPLSLLQQRWLLCEISQGMLVIDAKNAARTLLLEELLQAYTHQQLTSQPLLFPYSHIATEETVLKLLNQKNQLQNLGITLDQISHNTVIIRSMPNLLQNVDCKKFILLLIDRLKDKQELLAITEILALLVFAEQFMTLTHKTQQENLLHKLNEKMPLQLDSTPSFCMHISYAQLIKQLAEHDLNNL